MREVPIRVGDARALRHDASLTSSKAVSRLGSEVSGRQLQGYASVTAVAGCAVHTTAAVLWPSAPAGFGCVSLAEAVRNQLQHEAGCIMLNIFISSTPEAFGQLVYRQSAKQY